MTIPLLDVRNLTTLPIPALGPFNDSVNRFQNAGFQGLRGMIFQYPYDTLVQFFLKRQGTIGLPYIEIGAINQVGHP